MRQTTRAKTKVKAYLAVAITLAVARDARRVYAIPIKLKPKVFPFPTALFTLDEALPKVDSLETPRKCPSLLRGCNF